VTTRVVCDMAQQTPGPDASPDEVVEALRVRALSAIIYADVVVDKDKTEAAKAWEAACQLRCQAAVIEAMTALYDELGLEASGGASSRIGLPG
jgi:hypothetical protein